MFGLLQIICILLFELIYMVVLKETCLNNDLSNLSLKVGWLCILYCQTLKRNFTSDMVDWIIDCKLLLMSQATIFCLSLHHSFRTFIFRISI